MKKSLLLLCLMPCFAMANLVSVVPLSYTFDQDEDAGSYQYYDWTGRQLIDGQFGGDYWYSDVGNGNAYEWVAWTDPVVNIDFTFDFTRTFNHIMLSTDHGGGGVTLPSWAVYSWEDTQWVLQGDQLTVTPTVDGKGGIKLTMADLNFSSDKVRVQVRHTTTGPWSFVDEVQFKQQQQYTLIDQQANLEAQANDVNVIAPVSLGLIGLGLLGFRRTRKARPDIA